MTLIEEICNIQEFDFKLRLSIPFPSEQKTRASSLFRRVCNLRVHGRWSVAFNEFARQSLGNLLRSGGTTNYTPSTCTLHYADLLCLFKLCSGRGKCDCGTCNCDPGWGGEKCDCKESNSTCILPSSENAEICSGRGKCICGSCHCQERNNIRYSGEYCEECPVSARTRCAERAPEISSVHCDYRKENRGRNEYIHFN